MKKLLKRLILVLIFWVLAFTAAWDSEYRTARYSQKLMLAAGSIVTEIDLNQQEPRELESQFYWVGVPGLEDAKVADNHRPSFAQLSKTRFFLTVPIWIPLVIVLLFLPLCFRRKRRAR